MLKKNANADEMSCLRFFAIKGEKVASQRKR